MLCTAVRCALCTHRTPYTPCQCEPLPFTREPFEVREVQERQPGAFLCQVSMPRALHSQHSAWNRHFQKLLVFGGYLRERKGGCQPLIRRLLFFSGTWGHNSDYPPSPLGTRSETSSARVMSNRRLCWAVPLLGPGRTCRSKVNSGRAVAVAGPARPCRPLHCVQSLGL